MDVIMRVSKEEGDVRKEHYGCLLVLVTFNSPSWRRTLSECGNGGLQVFSAMVVLLRYSPTMFVWWCL